MGIERLRAWLREWFADRELASGNSEKEPNGMMVASCRSCGWTTPVYPVRFESVAAHRVNEKDIPEGLLAECHDHYGSFAGVDQEQDEEGPVLYGSAAHNTFFLEERMEEGGSGVLPGEEDENIFYINPWMVVFDWREKSFVYQDEVS